MNSLLVLGELYYATKINFLDGKANKYKAKNYSRTRY